MDTFERLTWLSNFQYGASHVREGVKKLCSRTTSLKKKFTSLGEIALGATQCIPGIGLIFAAVEKTTKNWDVEGRLHQRKLAVEREISSDSFKVQELYFDVCGSRNADRLRISEKTQKILDNSLPDIQIASCIRDIREYMEEHTDLPENITAKYAVIIEKLEKAQKIAYLISCCAYSTASSEEKFVNEMEKTILSQLESLQDGDSFLIPAGYIKNSFYDQQSAGGHAVLLEVKKLKENNYAFYVYNTGEGLNYHKQATSLTEKNKYYPLAYYGLSLDTMKELTHQITQLAKPSNTDNNISTLYDIFNSCRGIPFSCIPYAEQGNINNCPKKSLFVWLHQQFLGADDKYYWAMRANRLTKLQTLIKLITRKKTPFWYKHSIVRVGSTKKQNIVQKCKNGFLGMLGFRRPFFHIPQEDLNSILDISRDVQDKRRNRFPITNHYKH